MASKAGAAAGSLPRTSRTKSRAGQAGARSRARLARGGRARAGGARRGPGGGPGEGRGPRELGVEARAHQALRGALAPRGAPAAGLAPGEPGGFERPELVRAVEVHDALEPPELDGAAA